MNSDRQKRFRDLIAPLDERLIATAWRVLRDPGDAEEALQDTMLRVWTRLDRVERHPNPAALVLRMGANAAYDRLRKRMRENRRRNGRVSHQHPDQKAGPDARAAESELSAALRDAIAQLPRKQANAAIMRLVQEQSYAEIAAALGCSQPTARVHVLNARKRLELLLYDFRIELAEEILP